MLLEIGIIAAGMPAGWLLRKRGPARLATDKTMTWSVRILLFLIGLSLGSDKELLAGLGVLGARAVAICLLSVAGSMAVGSLLERRMGLEGESREEDAAGR